MSEFLQKYPIIKNYKISNVVCNEEFIEISFYDTQITLLLEPEGTCCSRNWFEDFGNPDILIDTYINTIDENPFYTNEDESNKESEESNQESDEWICCQETRIIYINEFTFKFRHICNGYYSGWVNYTLVPCDEINF